jgi:hemoglobin/transferrin/lactoferrin receptor protein
MKYFLMGFLLVVVCRIHAQTLSLRDGETNEPIEFATILSEKPRAQATTNSKGQADLSKFEGSERILIQSLGHEKLILSWNELKSSNFEIVLERSMMKLDEVVVSGTRWRQSTADIPSKITTISPREVEIQNPQTAADLLGVSGQVFIQKSQQGGGSPMIRGFSTNRLLYTVDGVRMNTAIFRGGNIQNVINLDPFATENTEVLFGPGSVIYGSDAIGGVMSFQTLTPQLSLEDKPLISGKGVARYSSANNEQTGHFDVNIGWKKWALVTSFSSWDYDHLRQGSNGPDDYLKGTYVQRIDSVDRIITQDDQLLQRPSAYSQINLMQKVRFKPNENWDFQYGFHYSETSPYGRYDRHNRTRNGTARYAEWDYGPQKWMMNNLTINHSAETGFYDEMSIRLAYQEFEESRISRDLNNPNREIWEEYVDAYSVNADFTKATGSKNTVFYGVEYVLNDVRSIGTDEHIDTDVVMPGPARYPNSNWTSVAAYINDEYRVGEKVSLQAGLRYNHFILDSDFSNNLDFYPFPFTVAEINSGAVTGSLGAVYRPSETWVFKTNFGTAFRAPNVDDVGKVFDPEEGSVIVPNPDLGAEYAYNVDLGVAKVIGNAVKVYATGYYTILENAIIRRDFQLAGQDSIVYDGDLSQVQALQNAARSNVYGIQAGIELKLPLGFSFDTDLNWQVGEDEEEDGSVNPSRHASPFFGVSRLSYQHQKINLEFYAQFQGERTHDDLAPSEREKNEIYALDANGNTFAPAWYTLNIKALYNLSETFKITAGVENLTDQRYRPYSSGISGPGRNFILALRADF